MFVHRNLAINLWVTGDGGAYNSFWGYLRFEDSDLFLQEDGTSYLLI